MKTKSYNALTLLTIGLLSGAALRSSAATFDSGSDGSYGPLNITISTTLPVPSNGVFNCTTINIACGADLSFIPNSLNTPVYLLATGDVTISGQLGVSGSAGSGALGGGGGPGGFAGGSGGIVGGHTAGGDGAGPGAGRNLGGWYGASFGLPHGANSNTYGNALLFPIIGGSGGSGRDAASGGYGGGGGGGALVIASNTKIELSTCCCSSANGYFFARGGNGAGNAIGAGGSGGAIRLIAPVVRGNGGVDTSGGAGGGCCQYADSGSVGRIRIDCLDDYSYRSLTFIGSFTRGSQMFVSRTNSPRLDIVEAAGQIIPLGVTNVVTIALPFGSPMSQAVKLRAENFTNDVPVRIVVTPDTGPSQAFDGIIPNTANPVTNTFNVTIPAGTISRVDAWTR